MMQPHYPIEGVETTKLSVIVQALWSGLLAYILLYPPLLPLPSGGMDNISNFTIVAVFFGSLPLAPLTVVLVLLPLMRGARGSIKNRALILGLLSISFGAVISGVLLLVLWARLTVGGEAYSSPISSRDITRR